MRHPRANGHHLRVTISPERRAHLRRLVDGAVRAPDTEALEGATAEDLRDLTTRLGRPVPESLSEWLTVCRGGRIGPGGIYGATPEDLFTDLAERTDPQWLAQRWFAVAGDGCGGTYVLTENGSIGFIDPMRSIDDLDSVVASDLLSFFEHLLAGDQAT